MSAVRNPARADGLGRDGRTEHNHSRRLSTETKSAFKTTEMIAFVVAVFGVLIAAAFVDESDAGGRRAPRGRASRADGSRARSGRSRAASSRSGT